jgi:predicted RNA-binding protein with PUA-like domain
VKYWLIKSEASCYSIDDLMRDKTTAWEGVRNYQARNFMQAGMHQGDLVLFYHSNSKPNAVAGVARVASEAHPDMSQFDAKDEHYDPKAKAEKPIWYCVDVSFVKKLPRPVTLEEIKRDKKLQSMMLCAPGSRLSVQTVSPEQFAYIVDTLASEPA